MTETQFKAATWNVLFTSKAKVLEPVLKRLQKSGVSIFLMQEAGGDDITAMLERHGLNTFVYNQWRLAWDPQVWSARKLHKRQLSPTDVVDPHGNLDGWCVIGLFTHLLSGEQLKAMSYHLPSHTQKEQWHKDAPNRWQDTAESIASMVKIARSSRVKHLLFGGDDNVDETRNATVFELMESAATKPLTQITAPKPTHDTRKIDDFRVAGLVRVGAGRVVTGGGDHRVFVQKFKFVH